MGRGHGRNAFRPLPGPGRAPPYPRQARGLRRHPPVDPCHRCGVAAFPLGQGLGLQRAPPGGGTVFPRLRCGELQHLPGPEGPEPVLQVWLAFARPEGNAPAGDRAQSRMHRDRPEAGLDRPHRVDRRRHQFSGPAEPRENVRELSPGLRADLFRAAQDLADVPRTQDVRARLLFHRDLRLGLKPDGGPASGPAGQVPR